MDRRELLAASAAIGFSSISGCMTFFSRPFEVKETSRIGWDGFQFDPRYVHVESGTTVTWVNNESYRHWLVAVSDNWSINTEVPPNGTVTHTFTQDGVYVLKCDDHEVEMKIAVGDAKIKKPIPEET